MNTGEEQKAKEAERHRKLRLKNKNELARLKCLEKFLCDKYRSILEEFKTGYDEENHTFAPRQQTTTTNSSSQTETEYNIFDQITTDDDLSWLPQLEDVDGLFARLVNGAE